MGIQSQAGCEDAPRSDGFLLYSICCTLRKWRNWQTHKLEVLALKGVGVQVPPSAPNFFRDALIPRDSRKYPACIFFSMP